MQNQYTKQAMNVIRYAGADAKKLQHLYIGTEHLLLGLRKEYTGVAGQVLDHHGVDEEKMASFTFADATVNVRNIPKDLLVDHAIECVGGEPSQMAINQMIDYIQPE